MIQCILGERETGKSVFVEEQVKKIDKNALYIATLPGWDMYQDVIQRHKQRRPSTWDCIEIMDKPPDQIFAYPFWNYRNVILDNLSYYVLFQICTNENVFFHEFYNGFLSLIDQLSASENTMVYMIDTPLKEWEPLAKDEKEIIYQIFFSILHKAKKIEKYHQGNMVCQITEEEGKDYFFHL